jgi:protein-tyrosine phosphatase
MTSTLTLASADNFRDVAGPGEGYVTATGRMRRGQFFRSCQLELTSEDVGRLTGVGVAAVHDLRPIEEEGRVEDVAVPGASWRHHPILGMPMSDVMHCRQPSEVEEVLAGTYRRFVTDPAVRTTLGRLVLQMVGTEGAQVFHCASGKDRTGWLAMLLQHIAGVDRETIVEDYLLSNEVAEVSRQRAEAVILDRWNPDMLELYKPALTVRRYYLEAGIEAAIRLYGSLDGYLAEGLQLPADALAQLHRRLDVKPDERRDPGRGRGNSLVSD